MAIKDKEIIVGLCGSIACYKAADLVNSLTKQGAKVTVIMTRGALNFITPLTLQTLSHNQVFIELFEPVKDWNPLHTSLADRAELIIVCPATASIIGKLASGIPDDLLTCTIMAAKAKVLICPAMNDRMYNNKIVQANIARLRSLGYGFIGPVVGDLADGRKGKGHIASLDMILKEVKKILR